MMSWKRVNKALYMVVGGGFLLQATTCDASSVLGNAITSIIVNTLLGSLAT